MVELKNGAARLVINPVGAELREFECNGRNILWGADPAYWTGVAPLLFPICGGLKGDCYTYNGRQYTLQKHGFARHAAFKVLNQTQNSAEFCLTATPETLKQYPFYFALFVTYTLLENGITVTYWVKNNGSNKMYFSIGSHEAYACPEGIENYEVVFPNNETLNAYELDGNLLTYHTVPVLQNGNSIALKTGYFSVDALVFLDLKSRSAILRNRLNGQQVQVEFPGKDYFLLWTKPGAGYICLEPWAGVQDFVDSTGKLEEKRGILALESGAEYTATHKITVLK